MDLSKLSREELLAALAKKDAETSSGGAPEVVAPEEAKCKYVPVRSNQKPCDSAPSTPWGFCKKHAKTIQADNAQTKWEQEQAKSVQKNVAPREMAARVARAGAAAAAVATTDVSEEEDKPRASLRKPAPKKPSPKRAGGGGAGKPEKSSTRATTHSTSSKKDEPEKATIRVFLNKWGRYEEPDTHFLFDLETKCAYGKQNYATGKWVRLEKADIVVCQARGWGFFEYDDRTPPQPESESEEESAAEEEEESAGEEEEEEESAGEEEEESAGGGAGADEEED